MAHAYKNKYDGYVLNSQFRERAASGLLGYTGEKSTTLLTLSYYHLTPGIVEGDRDENTGQFLMPVNNNGEEGERIATDLISRFIITRLYWTILSIWVAAS